MMLKSTGKRLCRPKRLLLLLLLLLAACTPEPEVVEVTRVVTEVQEVVVTEVVTEVVDGETVQVEVTRVVEVQPDVLPGVEPPFTATGSERSGGVIATAVPGPGSAPGGPPNPNSTATPPPPAQFIEFRADPGVSTADQTISTFGLDVDTGSYTLARAYLEAGQLPPTSTIRLEEFVNYFDMEYAPPAGSNFSLNLDGAPSPYSADSYLVRIGVQAPFVSLAEQPPQFYIFVVDVSGSMALDGRLDLVKESLLRLVNLLRPEDQVALVAYHTQALIPLPPTLVADEAAINAAILDLTTYGSSFTAAGLEMAYDLAAAFGEGRQTQLLLFSDGLTNIGPALADEILASAAADIRLHTFGLGATVEGDLLLEDLATQGNGSHAFLDSSGAVDELFAATLPPALLPVAEAAAIQVEFNPALVTGFRLLGYENRTMVATEFRDDGPAGGELGAGHHVTALYEILLVPDPPPATMALMATLRYLDPASGAALEQIAVLTPADLSPTMAAAPASLRLAALAAHFALWLAADRPATLLAPILAEAELVAGQYPDDSAVSELLALIATAAELP
ncbi:MAG: von Willebrand factor type A domain-containing protein [Ardenticatenales bacterium]|nr:von Willebrand factor type A domain-containing protein [Ardenticatenales bacterium]